MSHTFDDSENAADCFLVEKKVKGSAKNVAKKPKEVLIEAYEELFKSGAFKGSELDVLVEKVEKIQVEKDRVIISRMRSFSESVT